MHRVVTRILVICAVIAAFAIAIHAILRLLLAGSMAMVMSDIVELQLPPAFSRISVEDDCYPFRWQAQQRERLHQLLEPPTSPPAETGILGQARYAEYACRLRLEDREYEQAMREGMRRDPNNVLYYYLLAYRELTLSLEGGAPTKDAAGKPVYHYRVKDRQMLDQAMRELAAGLQLPYHSRRYELITARLDAMPMQQHWEEQVREAIIVSPVPFAIFPEFNKCAQVNGFYLSLLLSEGKRAKAEPFLRTGERLALQLAGDEAPSITSMLVALDALSNCARADAAVCRRYGLTSEAAEIERRNGLISRDARARCEDLLKQQKRNAHDAQLDHYAGILSNTLAPGIGDPQSLPSSALRIARLVEFTAVEGFYAALLPMLFIGLMLYSALKYRRWRWGAKGYDVPRHDVRLSGADWLRILLIGFLLPVALYAMYRSLPAISGREQDFETAYRYLTASVAVVMLWILIVPTAMAANAVWRRSLAAGVIEVQRSVVGAIMRSFSALVSLVWAVLAMRYFLVFPVLALVGLLASPPLMTLLATFEISWIHYVLLAVVLIGVAFIPAIWERRHPDCAAHFLALSRAMIPVYAVLALCTASLYPALLGLEGYYLRQDKMMTTMRTGGTIAFTQAEGRLVLELQKTVLEGAKQLENEKSDNRR